MSDVPPTIGYAIDPSLRAPEDYDVKCAACGVSIITNINDRCAACGSPIDLEHLPLARVPWLYRNRYGTTNAYVRTVARALLHPGRFAQELCRPVSISRAEAAAFRWMTIWVAVLSCAIAIAGSLLIGLTAKTIRSREAFPIFLGLVASLPALRIYFGLVTDLPTFIWKGRTERPDELAPLHLYACAPLALSPILATAILSATAVGSYLPAQDLLLTAQIVMSCTVAAGIGALWYISAILFARGAELPPKRQAVLALYLPLHGMLILLLSTLVWGASFGILRGLAAAFLS